MKKKEAPSGLCSGCRHASACTFPRDSRHAVLECEEFESPGLAQATPVSGKQALKERPPRVALDTLEHTGLCRDCTHRKHCALNTTEGGVWHCEEYT